jgi:hypothetical protein
VIHFSGILDAEKLNPGEKRLYVGAYGFEDRSLGWLEYQTGQGKILDHALMISYKYPKGENRIEASKEALSEICGMKPEKVIYNVRAPYNIENLLLERFEAFFHKVDEIILDISAMTKLLILVCLFQLKGFRGKLRIIYSEAEEYAPDEEEYKESKKELGMAARFPGIGVESIIRLRCLSSIRMQGQPVTMIAFTSFNEQLVRHMLATINPHRLLFINGHPPRKEFAWRERATLEIHKHFVEEYTFDNIVNDCGLLERTASTLDYKETIERLSEIYKQYGTFERIICAATGSKMQTVGLFFGKIIHPDIHIEYPTPDSYFVKGISRGVRKVHEVLIPRFSDFIKNIEQ